MKRTKIILSVLIAAILLFAGITANAGDNAEPKEDSKRLHELEGQRTLSSRAYAMSDGTVQHELFATDIHYKNNAGKVVPIDIKVKDIDGAKNQGYKYKNGENSWNVYFADKGKAQEMVKIEQDDYAISFSMNNSKSDAVASKAINMERGKSTFHDMYAEDPTVVIYQDAMPDIDVAYTIREHSIKEDIVFNKKPTTNEFTFDITTKNLNVVLKEDRLLYNDAKSGEQVFTSANLYMEDSKGNVSEDVSMKLESIGDNQYRLTIIADQKFLDDENTAYPVILDPTIQNGSTKDVFTSSYKPTTNMNSGSTRMPYLRTGKDSTYGKRRTFIEFRSSDIDNAVGPYDSIISARVYLKRYSSAGSINLRAYRIINYWTSSGTEWNDMPSYDSSPYYSSNVYDGWYYMHITDWVQGWEDGSITNRGVMIRDTNEGSTSVWATFRSSDNWSTDRRPKLLIVTNTVTPTATPTPVPTATPTASPSIDISSVLPSSGYLLQGESSTFRAYINANVSRSTTFTYPKDGTPTINEALTTGTTYDYINYTP